MLDSDLAKLYECVNGTKDINKAVKRNIDRFPNDFYFQLTNEETQKLWFQFGPANKMTRINPHVFTEEGVAMLSSVLKTDVASEMSVKIIRAFVYMRKYISYKNKNNILLNLEERILKLEKSFDKMSSRRNSIIYEGKVYDAYSILIDILNQAKEDIIIVDNYANKELFDILRNIDRRIIILSKNLDEILIKKYTSQYKNVVFIGNDPFHDRYIILAKKEVYISGMPIKKYSYIYKTSEELYINELMKRINCMI